MTIDHVEVPAAEAVGDPQAAPEAAPVVETTAPEPARPHPLQPGGVRFEEVYGKWKTAEGRATELERQLEQERLARSSAPPPAAPKAPSLQDVYAAHERGEIDALRAAELIAETKARESETRTLAALAQREKVTAATTEVQGYLTRVPELRDRTSETFRRVETAAYDLAGELGRPVSDPLVQRRALREALGPLDRLATKAKAEAFDRQTTDGGGALPAGGGGPGGGPQATALKGVPKAFADFWRAKGLSEAQIAEQATYLSPGAKARLGG